MGFKIFTTASILFVLFIGTVLGYQVYSLAGQVGQKDRSNLSNLFNKDPVASLDSEAVVIINDFELNVEIADDSSERSTGLMYRESLPSNSGMLFIFPREGIYSFWMKNTKIPLDIIWIDKSFQVVHIEQDAQPCLELVCKKYISQESASYVLETNAGWVKRAEVEIGSRVTIK